MGRERGAFDLFQERMGFIHGAIPTILPADESMIYSCS
jgi:hypothetical protein